MLESSRVTVSGEGQEEEVGEILKFLRFFWETPGALKTSFIVYRVIHVLLLLFFFFVLLFQIGVTMPSNPDNWFVGGYFAYYLIYFTNWGFTLLTVQGILGLTVTGIYRVKGMALESSRWMKILWKCYKTLKCSAMSLSMTITIVYYGAIRGSLNMVSLAGHAFNLIIMMIEFAVMSNAFTFKSVALSLAVGLSYVIFSCVYFYLGGVDEHGRRRQYDILNWVNPLLSVLSFLCVELLCFSSHCFLWCLYRVKVEGIRASLRSASSHVVALTRRIKLHRRKPKPSEGIEQDVSEPTAVTSPNK